MNIAFGAGAISKSSKKRIVTIGIFDGVHRGHQRLIQKVVSRAQAIKGVSIVFTFYPHPYHILKPRTYLPLLISLTHRLQLIRSLGVDACVVQPFTERFSALGAKKFIEEVVVKKLHPHEIYVGSDFSFGRDRHGDITLLKSLALKHNFTVKLIVPVKIARAVISSTCVRTFIRSGDLRKAQRFLGRTVSVIGTVVRGSRRGRILGYPTANIDCGAEVVPPLGVYAVKIILKDNAYYGMANIGTRPSFKHKKPKITVEVHIFRFKQSIYGKVVEIEFLQKIRDEKRFSSKAALITQIRKDAVRVVSILRRFKR
ncbi:bifunctional riboflavin kinase/FAD synthetase [Candidatus Omnitrophota bacterium]